MYSEATLSGAFRPALNVLSPGLGRYLPWQPCRFDCAASVATAQAVRAVAARVAPETVVGLDRAFALPRLHGDARCQVIFVGSVVAPMRVRYRTVCTPYALDRSAEDAALEWVFFMDAVAPLLLGETATVSDGEIQVQREGSTVARLPLHWDATFLPFAPG